MLWNRIFAACGKEGEKNVGKEGVCRGKKKFKKKKKEWEKETGSAIKLSSVLGSPLLLLWFKVTPLLMETERRY